jgi:hypothetical protein
MIDFDDTRDLLARWLSPARTPARARTEWWGARPEGRQYSIDAQFEAMRRREARLREANQQVVAAPVGIVERAVEAVVDAIPLVGKARGMAFLRGQLANGPLPATEIQRRAIAAGVTNAALRKGRNALGIRPQKLGGGPWVWGLPAGS